MGKVQEKNTQWVLCPQCGQRTRIKLRTDTELKHFPLFCPKCRYECLIDAADCQVEVSRLEDAKQEYFHIPEREMRIPYFLLIDTYISGKTPMEYEEYINEVKPIVENFGGHYLTRTNDVISLDEKRCPQRIIVIEFPTKEALDSCFTSEKYKSIMMKRVNNVDSRAVIVPGMNGITK